MFIYINVYRYICVYIEYIMYMFIYTICVCVSVSVIFVFRVFHLCISIYVCSMCMLCLKTFAVPVGRNAVHGRGEAFLQENAAVARISLRVALNVLEGRRAWRRQICSATFFHRGFSELKYFLFMVCIFINIIIGSLS